MAWIKTRVTDDGDTRFVACYRDPEGRQRSAGTYSSRRAAERAAHREEAKVRDGAWHDHSRGQVTFAEYVETVWLPSKHVETSTLAAYRSYLDKHFIPTFGRRPMGKILPSEIQRWVTTGHRERPLRRVGAEVPHHAALGLRTRPARPGRHLQPLRPHRAPQGHQEETRTLTPEEYVAILASLPAQHRLMVETAINTGLRWGELIALKPRHLDLIKRQLSVEETVVEVSIKNSPTGARMLTKPYPKDNEARTMGLPADLVGQLADWITTRRPGSRRSAVRHPRRHPDLPEHLPHPRLAARHQSLRHRLRRPRPRPPPRPRLLAPRRRLRPQIRHGPDGPRPDHHHPEVPPHPPRRRRQEPRRPEQDPRPARAPASGEHSDTGPRTHQRRRLVGPRGATHVAHNDAGSARALPMAQHGCV